MLTLLKMRGVGGSLAARLSVELRMNCKWGSDWWDRFEFDEMFGEFTQNMKSKFMRIRVRIGGANVRVGSK